MTLTKSTLQDYKEKYRLNWADDLPENCPPENILIPEDDVFYRLLLNEDKIVDDDLKNYIELYPNKLYKGSTLILASGLSIYSTDPIDANLNRDRDMSKFKGLLRLKLNPEDGVLMKTGGDFHYTWWRTDKFDVNKAEIVIKHET